MSKGRIVVALAIIAGGLGWVVTRQLSTSLIYYRTPTELVKEGRDALGQSTRLGGYVVPGSVRHAGDGVVFVVSDETTRMSVVATGSLPDLFREGQGVVLEGRLRTDGTFQADTVLVKHSGVYNPPAPGETPHSADLEGDG